MTTAPAANSSSDPHSALPPSRITVLDLTLARAGPTCVRHLADWGANIIRIEPPATSGEDVAGKRDGFDFQNLHRNKCMVRLDLKSEEGHAAPCAWWSAQTIGRPDWKEKEEWKVVAGRSQDRKNVNAAIAEVTKTKPIVRGGRRAVQSDLQHRPGLRRSPGAAPRYRQADGERAARHVQGRRLGDQPDRRAEGYPQPDRAGGRAYRRSSRRRWLLGQGDRAAARQGHHLTTTAGAASHRCRSRSGNGSRRACSSKG
ncbi:MAG: hypothetical protein GEV05_15795 [Betaproteobacteria bacterium]|nr:hypothetical protein [Betaproteobacteria bacterium]